MAKKTITKAGTETGYKRFLNNVNLYALGLDSISAEIKREAYAVAHAESASAVVRLIESKFELMEFTRENFDVRATFCLRVKLKEAAAVPTSSLPLPVPSPDALANDELLCIQMAFTAHFHCNRMPAGQKYAAQFAKAEARLIFWPYFRQTISDTTARMLIRPITVPLTLRP